MFEELTQSAIRPFRATPDVAFYFPHDAVAGVRQTVVRALQRAEGPTMVLGGAGLGKSLLADLIAQDLGEQFDIVRLSSARLCTRRALLQNILFELRMPYRNLSEGELRLSILDRLEAGEGRAPEGVLLIVDEADALPAKLLEELRLINNFNRNGQPRTRLALFGSLRLEDTFAEPAMESFSQRLAARCYLQPMNKRDTAECIRHQLRVAGVNPGQVITQEGLDCVYAASEGVPRLVNQIMDHTLMLAIANHQSPISAALVEEAWADLQQLPAPWHAGHEAMNLLQNINSSTVEFGTLNDEAEWNEDEIEAEPAEALATPTNFFAAFHELPLEDDTDERVSLPGDKSISEGSADEEVEQDTAPEREFTDQPEFEEEPVTASHSESYFAGRPSDLELIAFEDEQQQYDALGMWENDPPLIPLQAATQTIEDEPETVNVASVTVAPLVSLATSDQLDMNSLFGGDFEEEIEVPKQTLESSREWLDEVEPVIEVTINDDLQFASYMESTESTVEPIAEAPSLDVQADQPTIEIPQVAASEELELSDEAVNDYVYRLQQYADCVVQSQLDMAVGEEVLVGSEANESVAEVDAWQVCTLEGDDQHALNIARDIEDLVSQLNFSAFSVEPYSVEQIAIDAQSNRSRVEDSVRTGENEEVFMLHRPQELESRMVYEPGADEYDDDRHLLVVEEEVPAAIKSSARPADEKPPVKISPYNQLFARLRK